MGQNYDPNQPYQPPQPPYQSSPNQGYPSNSGDNYVPPTQYESVPPPPPTSYGSNSNPVYQTPLPTNPYNAGPPVPSYPNAGPPMPNYATPVNGKKSRGWIWGIVGVVSLLLVGVIVMCSFIFTSLYSLGNATENAEATATAIAKQVKQPTPTTSTTDPTPVATTPNTGGNDGAISLGQSHTSEGVSVTITSAKFIEGDDYASPKAGSKFVQVHIKITNVDSSEKKHYNPLDFKVFSVDDLREREVYTPRAFDREDRLSFGDLMKGDTVQGDLVFSIKENDANAKIRWEPVWDDDTRYEWKLGLY